MNLRFMFVAIASLAAAAAANAATIVNLSAGPNNPNGGPVSQANGGPTANPVVLSLTAGTYTVSLIGIADGGLYDAYSVATPAGGNYTEQFAGFSIDGTATLIQPLTPTPRYATAAAALAAYKAAGPLSFTLTSTKNVSFYIEDAASAFFADDTGGVSFSVAQVPEPASWAMMIGGFGAVGAALRSNRRRIGATKLA